MWIFELLEMLLAGIALIADLTDPDPKKRRDAWRGCGIVFLIFIVVIVIIIVFTSLND